MVPVYNAKNDSSDIKFINVDEEARKFATKEHSINIFLFSACRDRIENLNSRFKDHLLSQFDDN